MTKDEYKKYMKGALNTTKGVTIEAIGWGIGGNIAGSVDSATGNTMASKAFGTGASLAGMPSLAFAAKNIEDIFKQKKKK